MLVLSGYVRSHTDIQKTIEGRSEKIEQLQDKEARDYKKWKSTFDKLLRRKIAEKKIGNLE